MSTEHIKLKNEDMITKSAESQSTGRQTITEMTEAYQVLIKHFNKSDMKKKELFKILLLNEDNEVIKVSHISEGDEISCNIDAKQMFKEILVNDATSVAICHNHCSPNLNPS